MYLKRITITGFKSFANKTVLDLGPGITGVVGPNGSGKSNIADAIRWALGEQGKGRLRLADREEVVFAGSDKRAKASFAEVVLLFNNEDGAFPIDFTEVEISRRLYRSGEADYRLAGRSVRLADIQAQLAGAGFGISSYTVIGQGMIDSLLMSSPAERKLLFDEAAGIRGPELGREAALRKLTATETNLTRLRDLAAELAPRLAALQATVVTAAEIERLESRVADLRADIVAAGVAQWGEQRAEAAEQLEVARAALERHQAEAAALSEQLAAAREAAKAQDREREQLQRGLAALEHERDQLGQKLADQRAAVAQAEHHSRHAADLSRAVEAARTELTTATARRDELSAELATNTAAARRAAKTVDGAAADVAAAQAALVALRKNADEGTRDQYLDHALQILKTVAINLDGPAVSMSDVKLLVHKAGRLLSHATRTGAAELLAEVKSAQKQLESAMTKRETAIEHQTNITITGRSLEIDLAYQDGTVERAAAQLRQVESSLTEAQNHAAVLPELTAETGRLAEAFAAAKHQLDQRRAEIRDLTPAGADTQDLVSLAAQLERATAAATTAESKCGDLAADIAIAEAGIKEVQHQASTWNLPMPEPGHSALKSGSDHASTDTPAKTPARTLESLQADLVRAETMLEARSTAAKEQAAELEQADTRQTELESQITDLETAKADLEKVVTELDALIRSRFKENFQALAAQFSTYFARLFQGGAASLELTETEDGSYGINIKASPAGKRLASITALSGGERAMAGVALLAAILRVNPSPFIVLDEIDAALDEANSGRLAGILAELKEHSQLIVITHNRQTMRTASVLFGVTMNEHHVSHLLSLHLEEAANLAAR